MSQFKREINREKKSYSPNAKKLKGDAMTDGFYGSEPFSKTTAKRNVHTPPMGVKPLPKMGDDLEGQLNADSRSSRNIPEDGILRGENCPKIPRGQRRDWENHKRLEDKDFENVVNEQDTYGRVKHSVNRRAKSVD